MIEIHAIKNFFPPSMRDDTGFLKLMLKEYIQCQILEYISNSPFISRLSFIGGTNLRLIKRIDRFSEDLDFDCKGMVKEDFLTLTDGVLRHLNFLGYTVMAKDREHDALTAFRRSLYFPQLLFNLQLSGYRNERFLIKIEMEDQKIPYQTVPAFVQSCGFYFPIPVPPDETLCAMKISALLSRGKGRDFYDVMFLLGQTKPDFEFLGMRHGIHDVQDLKRALKLRLSDVELVNKQKDVQHLLFNRGRSSMIVNFKSFIDTSDCFAPSP